VLSFGHANGQNVKLKKGFVYVDGEKRFEYDKSAATLDFSLYTIGRETEILFMTKKNNETIGYIDDDFKQLVFIHENIKVETATYRSYPHKWFLEKLIKEKVLDVSGEISLDKLDVFIAKYDENITNRTIRD